MQQLIKNFLTIERYLFDRDHYKLNTNALIRREKKILCYIVKSGDIIQQFITLADTLTLSANGSAGEKLGDQSQSRTPTTILHPFIRK